MRRSIMKVGPSTLVVSLPSQWAKRFKLNKGDELNLEEQGNTIRIMTDKQLKESEAFVDISEKYSILQKVPSNLYKMGYNKITVTYDSKAKEKHRYRIDSQFDIIKEQADHFTGMNIASIKRKQSKGIMEIEERAELKYSEFKNTFNKSFIHLTNQSKQVLDAMKSGEKDLFNEVWMSERLINQATDFCMRILNTQGFEDYKKTGLMFYLTNKIEEIGDVFYHMYNHYHKNDFHISNSQVKIMEALDIILHDLASTFRKFDLDKLDKLSRETQKLIDYYEDNFNKRMSIKQLRSITYVYSALEEIKNIKEIIIALNHEEFQK